MGIILSAYVVIYASGIAHAFFLGFTIFVIAKASRLATRPRYGRALFWGLVGNAAVPLAWSFSYLVSSGPPQFVRLFLYEGPTSLLNGFLRGVIAYDPNIITFLIGISSFGLKVGVCAAIYLLTHRAKTKANLSSQPTENLIR